MKKIYILISLCLMVKWGNSQILESSQQYLKTVNIAPFFAGFQQNSKVYVNYRDQLPKMPTTHTGYCISYDYGSKKYNHGIGLLVQSSQRVFLKDTKVALSYNYLIHLTKNLKFRPAVELSFNKRSLDFEKLIFGDQISYDGSVAPFSIEVPPLSSIGYLDNAMGAVIYTDTFFLGFVADHLFMPNTSMKGNLEKTPISFSFYGGYNFNLRTNSKLSLSGSYKYTGYEHLLRANAIWTVEPFSLGASIKKSMLKMQQDNSINSISLIIGYNMKKLRLIYSYDFYISQLQNSGGAHEISLVYEFGL